LGVELGGEGFIFELHDNVEILSEAVFWFWVKITGDFASRDFSGAIISSQD